MTLQGCRSRPSVPPLHTDLLLNQRSSSSSLVVCESWSLNILVSVCIMFLLGALLNRMSQSYAHLIFYYMFQVHVNCAGAA